MSEIIEDWESLIERLSPAGQNLFSGVIRLLSGPDRTNLITSMLPTLSPADQQIYQNWIQGDWHIEDINTQSLDESESLIGNLSSEGSRILKPLFALHLNPDALESVVSRLGSSDQELYQTWKNRKRQLEEGEDVERLLMKLSPDSRAPIAAAFQLPPGDRRNDLLEDVIKLLPKPDQETYVNWKDSKTQDALLVKLSEDGRKLVQSFLKGDLSKDKKMEMLEIFVDQMSPSDQIVVREFISSEASHNSNTVHDVFPFVSNLSKDSKNILSHILDTYSGDKDATLKKIEKVLTIVGGDDWDLFVKWKNSSGNDIVQRSADDPADALLMKLSEASKKMVQPLLNGALSEEKKIEVLKTFADTMNPEDKIAITEFISNLTGANNNSNTVNNIFPFVSTLSKDSRSILSSTLDSYSGDKVATITNIENTLRIIGGDDWKLFLNWKNSHGNDITPNIVQPSTVDETITVDELSLLAELSDQGKKKIKPILLLQITTSVRDSFLNKVVDEIDPYDARVLQTWLNKRLPAFGHKLSLGGCKLASELWKTDLSFDQKLRSLEIGLESAADKKILNEWMIKEGYSREEDTPDSDDSSVEADTISETFMTLKTNYFVMPSGTLVFHTLRVELLWYLLEQFPSDIIKVWVGAFFDATRYEACSDKFGKAPGEQFIFIKGTRPSDKIANEKLRSLRSMFHPLVSRHTKIRRYDDDIDDQISRIDIPDDYPNETTILILGESGVGKSTFINSFANYLKSPTMSRAEDDFIILIRHLYTYMNVNGNDYEECERVFEATINGQDRNKREAEGVTSGKSKTKQPRVYTFEFTAKNGSSKKINIIDTPGIQIFQDADGPRRDDENFNKIFAFISGFKTLNAILLLLKPNLTVLNYPFRHCLNELMVRLPKSTSRNILFCFTHARETMFKPGQTLNLLNKMVESMKKKNSEVKISTDKDHVYCMDNESFSFLCGKKTGLNFEQDLNDMYEKSWKASVNEIHRMMYQIGALEPHKTQETLCLNNTRNLVVSLCKPLAEISKNLARNNKLYEEKIQEVEHAAATGEDIRGRLQVKQEVLRPRKLDYPMTVCVSERCVEYRRESVFSEGLIPRKKSKTFRFDDSDEVKIHYKQICHHHCYLRGIQEQVQPDLRLQDCEAMNADPLLTDPQMNTDLLKCRECNCSWKQHMHITYNIDIETIYVDDPELVKQNQSHRLTEAELKACITRMKRTKGELEKEQKIIINACAAFGVYLKKHALLSHNDAYAGYIEMLIKEEGNLRGTTSAVYKELVIHKDLYAEQVRILEAADKNGFGKKVNTADDMNAIITDLRGLKLSGKVIRAVQEIELYFVRDHAYETGGRDNLFIGDFSRLNNMGRIVTLNAILLLLKPNLTVLNYPFRHCLNELMVRLPKSTSRNILFCFTHARETMFKPGQTLNLLNKMVESMKKKNSEVKISTDKDHVYCMDNESFSFLCGKKTGLNFEQGLNDIYEKSWKASVNEIHRMMYQIGALEPHKTQETLCLNNTRNLVVSLCKPLAEISKNLARNNKLYEEKIQEVEHAAATGEDIRGRLQVKQEVLRPRKLDYPMTVCVSERCVEYRRESVFSEGLIPRKKSKTFRFDDSDEVKIHYKQICHHHCYLRGIQEQVQPDPRLQDCEAMNADPLLTDPQMNTDLLKCRECNCSWKQHMHITYNIDIETIYVDDPELVKQNQSHRLTEAELKACITRMKRTKGELEKEQKIIINACAAFGVYLKKHALLSHNDAYAGYIEMLIKEEGNLRGTTSAVYKELVIHKDLYAEQVRILEAADKNGFGKKVNTADDMNAIITDLRGLKLSGKVIRAVQEIELYFVRDHAYETGGRDNLFIGDFSRLNNMGRIV